jgi:predicted ATPase
MVTRGPKEKFSELTHVGVGVSQLLPIIVQGLVAKRPDILLFEQPELHLHPKLQTKLADFFYALSRSGIQCIIETHSEHIINRLRHHAVAAADKREDQSNNHTLLYYADQDRQGTKYQPLTINEYGIIEDWPEGFFDEIENSSSLILKASMAKVRARREAERLSHTID